MLCLRINHDTTSTAGWLAGRVCYLPRVCTQGAVDGAEVGAGEVVVGGRVSPDLDEGGVQHALRAHRVPDFEGHIGAVDGWNPAPESKPASKQATE